MISFKHKGDFSKTSNFLKRASNINYGLLEQYGREGVRVLTEATPKDSGNTAKSWSYTISTSRGRTTISWHNSNVVDDVYIAVILQYGHGTQNGGWIAGKDYINPALKSVFKDMAEIIWREVTK